jgi:hypothetical protein
VLTGTLNRAETSQYAAVVNGNGNAAQASYAVVVTGTELLFM